MDWRGLSVSGLAVWLAIAVSITVSIAMMPVFGTALARTQFGGFSDPDAPPTAAAYASAVAGTIVPAGQMTINGQSLVCGRRPTVLDNSLDDYGAAFPGFIILNPKLLARVPTVVQQWIYAHECAHQFRGPDEVTADCFAVQRGRRKGWLTTEGLEKVCEFIRPAAGSFMHPPGPRRCEIMRQCFSEDKVR